MKRINLKKLLQAELDRMYHNATPDFPTIDDDYEQDLFQSYFEDYCRYSIDDLEAELPDLERYGKLYAYGRGGRTLSPDGLMIRRGSSQDCIRKVDEIEFLDGFEYKRLYKTLKQFNDLVIEWNKSIKEWWTDTKEYNNLQAEIDKHKGKKRRTRTVYE
jgi:hypothetical protein